MLRSMTGYGRGEIEEKGVRVGAELRSVNNRYLEISPRLPRFLAPLEGEVKKVVQGRLSRGRVLLNVTWDQVDGVSETVSLDEKVADRYFELLKDLKGRYDLKGDVDLKTFAQMPDLFKREAEDWEPAEAFRLVKEALTIALEDLLEMRAREGAAIAEDLKQRVDRTVSHLQEIENQAPNRVEELKERLKARLAEITPVGEHDETLLSREVVIFAERSDCTEECVRYRIHSENFNRYVDEGGSIGRKLNFLLQEMSREANTMAVKASDAEISGKVVLIKEELEKIREQVQNVE